jgi:hypothetical protein
MRKEVCQVAVDAIFDSTSVEISRTEQYRCSIVVGTYLCNLCNRTGLVQMQTVTGIDNQFDNVVELRKSGFCERAIDVAPDNISANAVSSGTNSVLQ